ncbi:MAG: transketolase [Candidatus Paceibacterota bacterium]|jgi:transketolase
MNQNLNFRKEIINYIVPNFREDEQYYLLIGDMGFAVIDKLRDEFPNRVISCGTMEQGMVGIAAGMALSGLKPIVYTIVNFLVFRALEQIRNDVILHKLNVKFIGTGANNYFKSLGHSHSCDQNDILLMKLINLKVYDPYTTKKPFPEIVQEWLNQDKAAYIRV